MTLAPIAGAVSIQKGDSQMLKATSTRVAVFRDACERLLHAARVLERLASRMQSSGWMTKRFRTRALILRQAAQRLDRAAVKMKHETT